MTNDNWKASLAGLVFLAALGLICPLLAARSIPLVDPDEGLHASIAQEMAERGDWVVPRQLQEPFLDKPILYFWAIAASLKVFGNSEAAVRLPGLFFGMLGTITTVAIAWRTLGRRTGLVAGVFYASMVLPLALVQLPAHDVALVPWVNLALLCFWEADRCACSAGLAGKRSRRSTRLRARDWHLGMDRVAGFVLGLAILTKGLAGIALTGIAYGGYLILARRLRLVHCFRGGLALLIAAAVGSSWYIAVEQAKPGFIRYYFFERHVLGFLTNSQPHGTAPWWYYFPILLVGGLPWIGYLPAAAARHARASPPQRAADDRRPRPPTGTFVRLLVRRLHAVSHGVPFETDYLYLARLSGRGDPGRYRLGANDRRIGVGRGPAVDGRGRLGYLPDRTNSLAGYLRHNSDRGADKIFIVGVGCCDLCGAHFAGAALGVARTAARV